MPGVTQNQVITTEGNTKMLDIKQIGSPYSNVVDFLDAVNLLTGDWVTTITDCDKVFDGRSEKGVFYFGTDLSLKPGYSMDQYIQASTYDRYKFMPDHLEYFHVSDEACMRQMGILPGDPTILLYADKNQKKPYLMNEESTGGQMQLSDIIKFVLNGMSKWTPTWNGRSGALISEYAFNGLFYIEKSWPAAADEEANLEWFRKWQSKMITRMIIKMQDEPNNEHIPIRVSYEEMMAYEKSVRDRTF